jgi:hypothetical protein
LLSALPGWHVGSGHAGRQAARPVGQAQVARQATRSAGAQAGGQVLAMLAMLAVNFRP